MVAREPEPVVERLYATFAKYPRGKVHELCCDCDPREFKAVNDYFRRTPLRAIIDIDAVNYGGHGYGGRDDKRLRHFLPRLLELARDGRAALPQPFPRVDLTTFARDLRDADVASWPEEELRAIGEFLASWLAKAIESRERGEVRKLIAFAREAGFALQRWIDAAKPAAELDVRALARFVCEDLDNVPVEDTAPMERWIATRDVLMAFEEAFLRGGDLSDPALSLAAEVVRARTQ